MTIFSASGAQRGGIQILFGQQKQRSPALGSGLPWALKCSLTGHLTLLITNFGKWKTRKKRKSLAWMDVIYPQWNLCFCRLPASSPSLKHCFSLCFFACVALLRPSRFDPSLKQIWSYCSRHGQDDGSGTQLILRPSVCVLLWSLSDKPFKGMHKNSSSNNNSNNNNRRQQGCATATTTAECAHIAAVVAERRSKIESAC